MTAVERAVRPVAVPHWEGRRTWANVRWLLLLLVAGAVLRAVAVCTYFGGVDFHYDSYAYLNNAAKLTPDLWHPIVYPFLLRVVSLFGSVSLIAVLQALMGLGTGLLVYKLGRDMGLSDAWATLSAAPVVLDAWQVAVEQTVMSEPVCELLLATGLLLLLGRRTPSWPRLLIGGTALSLACLTRTAALPVMALTLLFLLVRRVPLRRVAATALCCALPLLGYAAAFASTYGPFELSGLNGRTLYGETATFARCSLLPHTQTNEVLCPHVPLSERAGNNQYTWDVASPLNSLPLAANDPVGRVLELNARAAAFAKQVIHDQPLGYAHYVADTTGRYFTVGRQARLQDFPQVAWQFLGRRHPAAVYDITLANRGFEGARQDRSQGLPRTARLLRDYQKVAYTPGPLLALAAALGLWVALTRRRLLEAGFLSIAGLTTLIMPSLAAGFDYRYLLPSLLLLPLAGALAAADLVHRDQPRRRASLWGPRVAAVLLLALVAVVNASQAGIMSGVRQTASRTTALGQPALLGQGVSARIGEATATSARCGSSSHGRLRWSWNIEVPVQVSASRAPHLVQGASMSFQGSTGLEQQPLTFRSAPGNREVPTTVSGSSGSLVAVAGFQLTASSGLVRWSDSAGAGVAQWRVVIRARGLPSAGSACFLPGEILTPMEP